MCEKHKSFILCYGCNAQQYCLYIYHTVYIEEEKKRQSNKNNNEKKTEAINE